MKRWYVGMMHGLRRFLAMLSLLPLLDRCSARWRFGLWIRSLLAIHDLEDMANLGVPWWTFESADRVDRFLRGRPEARVFEWGSGASTLWLADRAADVISVEHDTGWAGVLSPRLPAHVALNVVPAVRSHHPVVASARRGWRGMDFSDYVNAIRGRGEFDLVVVDGRAREACLPLALSHLAPDGLIVLDNVERARYRKALADQVDPTQVETTRGLTPALPYPTSTALVRAAGSGILPREH